jgi:phosphoribosylformimino-5-aminoimidazole carboxamide ribotide isomerase
VIVIPAIDLREGRVVRLTQGDPTRATEYEEDPVRVARRFEREGATLLHVVDLDAALGDGSNRKAVEAVCSAIDIPVQVGGGLRTMEMVEDALAAGAARVVLGSAAVWSPGFVRDAVHRCGGRVVIAVDVRGDRAMARGWKEEGPSIDDLVPRLDEAGAPRYLVTSIDVDGTMQGPGLALYERFRRLTDRPVIASGGVGSVDDLRTLADAGVEAAVVGRALYEGRMSLRDALAVTSA